MSKTLKKSSLKVKPSLNSDMVCDPRQWRWLRVRQGSILLLPFYSCFYSSVLSSGKMKQYHDWRWLTGYHISVGYSAYNYSKVFAFNKLALSTCIVSLLFLSGKLLRSLSFTDIK